MKITIITAVSRPENLELVHKSIFIGTVFSKIEYEWFIVEDGNSLVGKKFLSNIRYLSYPTGGVCGHPQINKALDEIDSGYVYILDDDNILHNNLFVMAQKLLGDSNKALISTQIYKNGIIRLSPEADNIKRCHIDSAQFLVPRDMIGNLRWENQKEADGIFFSKIYKKYKERFVITDEILCYYNYLR